MGVLNEWIFVYIHTDLLFLKLEALAKCNYTGLNNMSFDSDMRSTLVLFLWVNLSCSAVPGPHLTPAFAKLVLDCVSIPNFGGRSLQPLRTTELAPNSSV